MNSLLRFITAGSVDDGKSTLIGRLLFDSKGIFDDQLSAINRSKFKRTSDQEAPDLSLLTDGLEAEREQGITIDVAYRYFSTPTRKFIIADSPGHEQYTRNMVTAASTADAVVILIDASKIETRSDDDLLLPQSKRHTLIAHLLGVQHIIVAVNKMDLFQFNQVLFERIVKAYRQFAAPLSFTQLEFVPISALKGINVVHTSELVPWYQGKSVLDILEAMTPTKEKTTGLRFPVQWVARHDGSEREDFRGYAGTLNAGSVQKGMEILVLPSGQKALVKDITVWQDNQLQSRDQAQSGDAVIIVLDRNLDISRGDMLISPNNSPIVSPEILSNLCWLSETPFSAQTKYWLKHTTRRISAKISAIDHHIDIHNLSPRKSEGLILNDIAQVRIRTQQALYCDPYRVCRASGAFILIDPITHATVAAGTIIS